MSRTVSYGADRSNGALERASPTPGAVERISAPHAGQRTADRQTATRREGPVALRGRTLPLFWRLFPLNAGVLVVASAVLGLTPLTVSSPLLLSEAVILVAGLSAMLVINVVLTRRALVPLSRLSEIMGEVDLLSPGQRIPIYRETSEVVQLTESFNAMLDRLEGERRETARRAMGAQEAERHRIAQELHDAVGQSLTVVLLELDKVARGLPDEQRVSLARTQDAVRGSIDETRRIVAQLRPEALDDLGLRSAVASLIQRVSEGAGVTIDRHLDNALPALSPAVELVVYRIAQEALTNAVRHSGASRVEVHLRRTPEGLRLLVCDDGVGLRGAAGPGGGVRGMRERAMMVGAELHVDSRPGEGVEVCVDVDATEPSGWWG